MTSMTLMNQHIVVVAFVVTTVLLQIVTAFSYPLITRSYLNSIQRHRPQPPFSQPLFGKSVSDKDATDNNADESAKKKSSNNNNNNNKSGFDDGLTNRFKYKLNALMGTFDPIDTNVDNERQSGNILNAMMTFPVQHTFVVVGKTGVDDDIRSKFITDVRMAIESIVDYGDDVDEDGNEDGANRALQLTSIPRGQNYVKVTVKTQVESAAMITAIHSKLKELDLSVMQF